MRLLTVTFLDSLSDTFDEAMSVFKTVSDNEDVDRIGSKPGKRQKKPQRGELEDLEENDSESFETQVTRSFL